MHLEHFDDDDNSHCTAVSFTSTSTALQVFASTLFEFFLNSSRLARPRFSARIQWLLGTITAAH
ncbi:hypothetical protein BDR07DRAFT_1419023, partial [Suillus spraguei]